MTFEATGARWKLLRRYLAAGGWTGNALFLAIGVHFGFYIGGFGGAKFFEELFLIDLTGAFASLLGSLVGVFVATLSIWAILVIVSAAGGALVYFLIHLSFPSPYE